MSISPIENEKRKLKIRKKKEKKPFYRDPREHPYYWLYRGLGITGGIILIITLFLPWYCINLGQIITITPLYIYYNGIYIYFWDYILAGRILEPLMLFLIIMDVTFVMIILSVLYSLFKCSRLPSMMTAVIIGISFLGYGIGFEFVIHSNPSNPDINFPFFGVLNGYYWGFSIGWFLLFLSLALTLFFRRLVHTFKKEFILTWKQTVKEMQD